MAADIYPDGRTAPGKDAPPGFWRDMARQMTENCKLPCPLCDGTHEKPQALPCMSRFKEGSPLGRRWMGSPPCS
jgi:hypothetical protein